MPCTHNLPIIKPLQVSEVESTQETLPSNGLTDMAESKEEVFVTEPESPPFQHSAAIPITATDATAVETIATPSPGASGKIHEPAWGVDVPLVVKSHDGEMHRMAQKQESPLLNHTHAHTTHTHTHTHTHL